MGIYDRDYTRDNYSGSRGQQFKISMPPVTPMVMYLLIANLAIFFVSALIPPLNNLFKTWFSVYPSNFFFSIQVWRLVTYQFLHGDFMHVFFNMMFLYVFGPDLEQRFGRNKFITFYLICGSMGGILFTIFVAIGILNPAFLVGASGAILGLVAAAAILTPNRQITLMFFFTMTYRVLALIVVAMSTFFFIFGSNEGGDTAHLAGMATGAVYILWKPWLAGKMQRSENTKWSNKLAQERAMQVEVDRILDKINSHGIASLTRQEKKTLKQASQRQQYQRK